MYKLIGADQKEYGPAGADQIRQWIAEGRANGETKIQSEGQSEWRPLSHFPEFAAALQARINVQNQPPSAPAVTAQSVAGPVLAHDWQLDIGSCFSRSFALLQQNFWLVVGACAIVSLVQIGLGGVLHLFGIPVYLLLGGVFTGGIYVFFLKLVRGQPASVGDVFSGFNLALGPLVLVGLISAPLIALGLCLCILPGIYLAVSWLFAVPLVIDKKLDFWPAMETSRQIVSKHWWTVFALGLMFFLTHIAGIILCFLGWFVAAPLAFGALAYAYEDIFNHPTAAHPTPMPTATGSVTP
jgi:GYF domain 2